MLKRLWTKRSEQLGLEFSLRSSYNAVSELLLTFL